MVSFPSFSSFFTSKIVLRILGGVNVGADTQQCLVILRWISLISAVFISFSYLNSVTLEKLTPNHRKPSDFESPKGERNNTPPTKHLLTTLQPWNKTSPSPSSSSFSLFSSPLPASWSGPCRITSHFSRRRGPLMKRAVEGKNNGDHHPSHFYSLLFSFFTPVTINETISAVCAFRCTMELRWTGRCNCSCLLFRPSTTGTYTDYPTVIPLITSPSSQLHAYYLPIIDDTYTINEPINEIVWMTLFTISRWYRYTLPLHYTLFMLYLWRMMHIAVLRLMFCLYHDSFNNTLMVAMQGVCIYLLCCAVLHLCIGRCL